MHISTIELENFRNLVRQNVSFDPGLTVIVGKNGHGKTSLLEAIYLLSQPRSFRGARGRELPRWEDSTGKPGGNCRVRAEVETVVGRVEVAYQIDGGERDVTINGKAISRLGSFLGRVTTVEFTPDELSLLKGPPSNRRQFLDKTLAMLEPAYVDTLVAYNRAVKSRNKVLATAARAESRIDELIGPWDKAVVDYGVSVCRSRQALTASLIEPFCRAHSIMSSDMAGVGRAEEVALTYRSQFLSSNDSKIKSETELAELLVASRERDLRTKTTNFGVHHDDLIVELTNASEQVDEEDEESELFSHGVVHGGASQGQIRSAALSLKLASAQYIARRAGDAPILLLDDVESELDEQRRRNLFALVLELGHQVFVTTTDLSRSFAGTFKDARIVSMDKGRIS